MLWYYPVTWVLTAISGILKLVQLIARFVVGGLQAVFKTLDVGAFGEKIYYTVLKENGQYLPRDGYSLEDLFTIQLFDYSTRSNSSMT